MGIQYADKPKQTGEMLVYSMEYVPGKSIAVGDSLTGSPTVVVTRLSDGHDVTADDALHIPPIVGMVEVAAQRQGNVVLVGIGNGDDGETYKVTFTCDTTAGELDVEEDLILEVKNS
jgi:hypothetical protein